MKRAIIIVDVQRDFCEGGALAAHETMSLLEPLLSAIQTARNSGILVVFTQDWHPVDHKSFRQYGGKWPPHCLAGSFGAQLTPPLETQTGDVIVQKGRCKNINGYSAFEATNLTKKLFALGIEDVAITGIATEFCVRASALDALKDKFNVAVLTDLIRPVKPDDSYEVLTELKVAGVALLDSLEWLKT